MTRAGGALLVVGDVVTDVVARHRGQLARGTDTAASIRTVPGGAGANVACWAAHWGCADVALLGRVGADSAHWHEEALVRAGVRPRLVVDAEAPTGAVVCLVDEADGGERTFLTDSGACLRAGPEDWSAAYLDGVGWLHLSGYLFFSATGRALVGAAVRDARARAVPVSVDPASAGFLRELGVGRFLALAEGVDVLVPSRDEAVLLAGVERAEDAGAKLSGQFPVVVVKAGAVGACVARGGVVRERVSGVEGVVVRDSTGAGDAFTGAMVAARLRGESWRGAVVQGCRAGAAAVGRIGGRPPE
ncbi:PfkB family carbohydrate kinase [Streptomyces sp. VRA16 Mangrove soil]|uniref:carbohydrate kinase family protein n=1 Tax=Streptomyces sp. VRA16 Mangrove soil TaxID=2817434 RepID=UPI001A9E8F8B|nr:PfkB family carbohydrate kinase [Streptomyces sp. VRA16 Mangrove soil]MBO1335361.1 sugar kinase [Streptomyces sp. VRA16 Mangrove soil]